MNDYQPAARRPIAVAFRRTAALAVKLCVKWRIHPDVISYGSMVAAAAAAACFWLSSKWAFLLLFAPLFCVVRLWMNMLDGMVALAAGKASPRGEILNDLPDRVSDVLIFAGVAHSGWCHILSGYWAAIIAVMTAYVGMLGQAVGAKRQFGGLMSKPWRMVILGLGSLATFVAYELRGDIAQWEGLTILDWTCLLITGGCAQTIAVRLKRTFAELQKKGQATRNLSEFPDSETRNHQSSPTHKEVHDISVKM